MFLKVDRSGERNHQATDRDGGGQQDEERSDHQATKHFPIVNLPENVHWGRKMGGPRLVRIGLAHFSSDGDADLPRHIFFAVFHKSS